MQSTNADTGAICYHDDDWFDKLKFKWLDRSRQMRFGEILLTHGSQRHLLFMTTEGYDSEKDSETLGQDDAVYIHSWKTQKRVVARNLQNGVISVPLEYPINFTRISDGYTGTLERIIGQSAQFPVRVRVTEHTSFYYDDDVTRVDVSMTELELVHIYEETYVIANLILNGNIRPEYVAIPFYSPIRGVTCEGLLNHPDEDWTKLMDYYRQFVESLKLNLDSVLDKNEINMYSHELIPGDDNDYAALQPDVYIKFDASSLPPVSDVPPARPPRSNRPVQKEKQSFSLLNSLKGKRAKPKLPTDSGEKMRDNGKISRPLPPPPPTHSYEYLEAKNTNEPISETDEYEYITEEMLGSRIGMKPKQTTSHYVTADKGNRTIEYTRAQNDYHRLPNIPRTKPSVSRKPNQDGAQGVGKVLPVQKPPAEKQTQIVIPTESRRTSYEESQQISIKTIKDIPDDVSQISVDEVSDCLRLLNLGNIVNEFREKQVDGSLMTSLDVQTLVDCFSMPRFDAVKLEKFFNSNWRPKFN